MGIKAIR
jgi:hypothetical protein